MLLHVSVLLVPVSLALVRCTHPGKVASLPTGVAFCGLGKAALFVFGVIHITTIIPSFQDHIFMCFDIALIDWDVDSFISLSMHPWLPSFLSSQLLSQE